MHARLTRPKTVVISPSTLWHNVETWTISTPHSFPFFPPPCCFLSCGRCFVVAVLFYPLADWYRLYVFPSRAKTAHTQSSFNIYSSSFHPFFPQRLHTEKMQQRLRLSFPHLYLSFTWKQPSTSFKHTKGHQTTHTLSWIGAVLWNNSMILPPIERMFGWLYD